MEHYKVKIVPEADYKPADGEPFGIAWGREGWVVGCKTLVQRGRPSKKSVKRKPKIGSS